MDFDKRYTVREFCDLLIEQHDSEDVAMDFGWWLDEQHSGPGCESSTEPQALMEWNALLGLWTLERWHKLDDQRRTQQRETEERF